MTARNQTAKFPFLLYSGDRLMQAAGRLVVLGALLTLTAQASAQSALPLKHAPARTQTAITPADLMTRLYLYSDDSMMGRLAGSEYNLKATAYIASEVKRFGLQPAGDSGGYFQNVPLVKRQLEASAGLSVDATALRPWDDFVPRDPGAATRSFDGAQVVYAGVLGDSTQLTAEQAAGKFIVIGVRHGPNLPPSAQVNRGALLAKYRGAAGIAVAALETFPPQAINFFRQPQTILQGSDPKLNGEYVAIGAHNDHIGFDQDPVDHDSIRGFNDAVRKLQLAAPNHQVTPDQVQQIHINADSLHRLHPARRDSIFNGADDDGSGTVALLEIAQAFAGAKVKPKRSLIFVSHTGEELGLFGSQYFTDHPTVPRDSIVAQLNMDMIGRGRADDENGAGPGYLQLIGTRRLSTELGDLIEAVNKTRTQPFTFDYQFDATGHPEQYYCRSDHYMYARYGIPIAFFTTGNHRDYHQVTDEPEYIDYDKLAHVSQFVYDIAKTVANLDHRVVVDKPKPDPHGNCVQ